MADEQFLTKRLAGIERRGGLRELPGTRQGIDFWSNDYLGFARNPPPITESFTTAPGSRLISGDRDEIQQLEERIAAFHDMPAALIFGSGYAANTGLISCIAGRTDTIIYDELIHASIRDGIRLSGAAARRCKHNSVEQASSLIRKARQDGEVFFLTESRFSMDGDVAPLRELSEVCTELGAHLIVDEAHSIGIDGPLGAGLVAELNLQQQVFAVVTTYGKAMGCAGAAVLGSMALRAYLINSSRPFIFTTAPRPEQLTRIEAAYRQLKQQQPAARALLTKVLKRFSINAFYLRIQPPDQTIDGPIQVIYPRGNGDVIELEQAMLRDGFLVKGIRAPSVPRGQERLRICLHAFNTEQEVDDLTGALRRRLEQLM